MHDSLPPINLKQITKHHWRLEAPYTYKSITIPKGFITDGASTPLGILIPPFGGHYDKAVVVHDYLYGRLNNKSPHPQAKTRRRADWIFVQMLKDSGVAIFVRSGMWLSVRLFGGPLLKKIAVK